VLEHTKIADPTHVSSVMFTGFSAYHHHSQFYTGFVFVVSWGGSVQAIFPFLYFCKKIDICNGIWGIFMPDMLRNHRLF